MCSADWSQRKGGADLEEFIKDQAIELDKMEAVLKQTVANKDILEREFRECNVCALVCTS